MVPHKGSAEVGLPLDMKWSQCLVQSSYKGIITLLEPLVNDSVQLNNPGLLLLQVLCKVDMIVCIVLLSAHPALSSGSSHLTTQKELGDKVVYTFSSASFPFVFISLVICWRRVFIWGAPGGRVTTVSVKICSKQAICPLTVSISSGRVEASAYWTKLGPAKPGVKCKATETSSSWQASSKRVKSRKKIPKLMWRPGGAHLEENYGNAIL